MISHAQRVIFIHVPKTAGTSVEAALGHHAGAKETPWASQDHRSLRQLQWPHGGLDQWSSSDNRREAARAIKSRFHPPEYAANRQRVTREQFRTYFKFSVVRNPWARAFSWYQNVLPDGFHRDRLGVQPDISFSEFMQRFAGVDLLRPQTHWLVDHSGRIGVDFVCRFERLADDYAYVCGRAGIGHSPLPHLNRTGGSSYVDAYDDRTRKLVADRFDEEIKAFGHTFADAIDT